MVNSTQTAQRLTIVAQPNQSASWRSNVLVLCALAVPMLGAGVLFAVLGAWLILPLAGLELLALAAALYRVQCKLQYRHIITVSDDTVCIDKGYFTPEQQWRFAKSSAGLTITARPHPWDGPQLCLHDRTSSVTLGEFLNREDSLKLIALLRREIRVRAQSPAALREF